jgi:hypothetical protein
MLSKEARLFLRLASEADWTLPRDSERVREQIWAAIRVATSSIGRGALSVNDSTLIGRARACGATTSDGLQRAEQCSMGTWLSLAKSRLYSRCG